MTPLQPWYALQNGSGEVSESASTSSLGSSSSHSKAPGSQLTHNRGAAGGSSHMHFTNSSSNQQEVIQAVSKLAPCKDNLYNIGYQDVKSADCSHSCSWFDSACKFPCAHHVILMQDIKISYTKFSKVMANLPVTVTALSKAWNVFALSNTGGYAVA